MHLHHYPRRLRASCLLLFATLVLAGTASAIEPDPTLPVEAIGFGDAASLTRLASPSSTEPVKQTAAVPRRVDGFGAVVEASGLAGLRGGNDVENEVDINGVVGGNHAEDITSGTNTLAGDAFANANGINTVIQNSGSNVLIQNGMVVNVQFAPSP